MAKEEYQAKRCRNGAERIRGTFLSTHCEIDNVNL